MNSSIIIIISLTPILAIFNFLLNQAHFLIVLLSLEGIILSIVLYIPISISSIEAINISTRVVMLTIAACEARLGLSLIVLMSRSCGRDILKTLSINKC